ncbi:ABC transporter permease [Candidatus Methylacidithermus pantelleriae]|uniref:Murein tripeptide ABC transporter/oligopeptide ABC transporter inner membrane subunit OppB n=1 Tax=Candidatus Methylacidithermus pantelleriae TaxID=2744239 RepID=A0A8J2BJH3_9BACT|nr:ABC transporter permease subunit [Candidatus Methylacidithermus pantelleriae]CAF0692512.1 murein tripeptide ABC transporter/oligopeptide ABC transporter inner membrane subunit OppB [Candidatus Methylacidithermus pantelleriae]
MVRFIVRRVLGASVVVFAVVSITFVAMRIAPGSPFSDERAIAPEILRELEARYKLQGPIWSQYLDYWQDLLRGDLRLSTKYRNRTVREILEQSLPISLGLGSLALVFSLVVGSVLGCLAALWHNRSADRLVLTISLAGLCIPSFVLAPLAIFLFSLEFRLVPAAGWGTPRQALLPVLCLAAPPTAIVARLLRASLLEVLEQDFIRTAHAKGLSWQRILWKHAFRPSLLPLISYASPLAANLLTGSMVIEEVFHIPGMGSFFVQSVLNRDVFVTGGIVLVYSLLLVSFNLISDIFYALCDPRIRLT